MENHSHTKNKIPCAACGTSPVNHRLTYLATVIDEVLDKTMGILFGWVKVPREGIIANAVSAGMVGFFRIIGQAHFDTDIERSVSGRSKLIWEEASRRGIRMEQIVMFGKHLEQYRARIGKGKNAQWIYFQSLPIPSWLPQKGYDWVDDKFKLGSRLEKAGIAAPKVRKVISWMSAQRAFEKLDKPVIVKPRSGSRGRHTTTHIKTLTELKSAFKLAKMISPALVVEEHLFGSVFRATVIDGKLVGFFRADPPQVTGDGVHTIAELIAIKNEEKNKRHETRLGDIIISEDTTSFIGRYGHTTQSILEKDTVLDLSAKTGRLYGGYTREMLPEIHPKLHEIFARAGKVVDASIVGFDLIMSDPTKDPDTQKWGVIECNSLPFIDLHYFALEGTPINLAKNIWDLWENHFATKKI